MPCLLRFLQQYHLRFVHLGHKKASEEVVVGANVN